MFLLGTILTLIPYWFYCYKHKKLKSEGYVPYHYKEFDYFCNEYPGRSYGVMAVGILIAFIFSIGTIYEIYFTADNIEEMKLNWDKIAEKVFCFLNIGILSENDTIYYRHNISIKNVKDYVLVRDVISEGVNGQIRMQLTTSKIGNEEILVPTSIMYIENAQKSRGIKVLEKEYQFAGKATITKKEGGNYGK
jgi:hypothetical protein